jgi:hypothetical protein
MTPSGHLETFRCTSTWPLADGAAVSNDLIASTAAQALDIQKGLSLCVQGEIKPSEWGGGKGV